MRRCGSIQRSRLFSDFDRLVVDVPLTLTCDRTLSLHEVWNGFPIYFSRVGMYHVVSRTLFLCIFLRSKTANRVKHNITQAKNVRKLLQAPLASPGIVVWNLPFNHSLQLKIKTVHWFYSGSQSHATFNAKKNLSQYRSLGGRQSFHSPAWMTPRASKSTRKQIISARIHPRITGGLNKT